MIAPIDVPTMKSTGTRASSSTLSTPTCEMPRAPPPDSTRATRGLLTTVVGAAVVCARAGLASSSDSRPTDKARASEARG